MFAFSIAPVAGLSRWLSLLCLGLAGGLGADAARPYQPSLPNAVTQDFAWSQVESLADQQLNCLDVDADNRLWIGMGSKVLRWDGRERVVAGAADGVLDSQVIDILAARDGNIYVFHRNGISLRSGGLWRVIYDGTVNSEAMELATEGRDGTIWAAGVQGLFQINHDHVLLHRSGGEALATVFEDHAGALWTAVLDDGRTYRIARSLDTIVPREAWEVMLETTAQRTSRYGFVQSLDGLVWRFSTDPYDPTRFYAPSQGEWQVVDFREMGTSNQIQGHFRTRDGIVWVVSDGVMHGLVDGEWSIHRSLPSRHGPMRANLAQAPNGDLWLLDYMVSLHRIDYTGRQWRAFDGLLYQLQDGAGTRWFISESGALVSQTGGGAGDWWHYGAEEGVMDKPVALLRLRSGAIWAIGSDRGQAAVSVFDGVDRWSTTRYPRLGESLFEDGWAELPDGDVLLAQARLEHWRFGDVGAVVRLDPRGVLRPESVLPSSFLPSRTVGLKVDAGRNIWINEGYGLLEWTGGKERPLARFARPGFWIDDFLVDAGGELWIANWGQGVWRGRPGAELTTYAERDGLSSRFVAHLLRDEVSDTVFALTSEGLDRFDGTRWQPVGGAHHLVNNRDASFLRLGEPGAVWIVQGNRPWFVRTFAGSAYMTPQDEAFRSVVYRPEQTPPDTFLEITHQPDGRDRGLSVTWWGEDPWSETPVSDLRYSYRLDGGPWSEFSGERRHSFHQLDDGAHVLEVRARDQAFNVDPTPARFAFEIPPPMWRQPWFVAVMALVGLTILALVGVILRQRWRHLIEYDAQRISFFTNISHELRTPLALIMAPLEKAVATTGAGEPSQDLTLALRSARRLNQLVDQLLDFRKVESGAMALELSDGDLVMQLEEIVAAFQSLAETKRQRLSFTSLRESWSAAYDLDKLHKVVANLVVNALKYTPRGGRIRVAMEAAPLRRNDTRAWVTIRVEDDGHGISADRQTHLFEPFYRAGAQAAREATGTGLGLSLSKQLVRIMGGTIALESPLNPGDAQRPGSRFVVTLPLWPTTHAAIAEANQTDPSTADEREPTAAAEPSSGAELQVLLIDDNDDMREFLGRELRPRFDVSLAEDGLAGLALARELVPDLVIADVMMPRMNGIEFCRALKSDPATSHIPVIMLTARTSSEFEQEGLESGADDYLTKPISLAKLELRVTNLLENRRRLQERLRAQVMAEPAPPERTDPEAVFLQRVVDVIETHLTDGTCGVDELAVALSLSRSSFYRKLKAVTGETPNDFIRRYRMQRAAQLLEGTALSVTDVMMEVGYAELGHFGKLFKAFHGHSPSEHRARARKLAQAPTPDAVSR